MMMMMINDDDDFLSEGKVSNTSFTKVKHCLLIN